MSASILPTVSLLVGAMGANGRSVKGINDLHTEIGDTIAVLWAIFGLVVLSVLGLLVNSLVIPPLELHIPGSAYFVSVDSLLYRLSQGITGGAAMLALTRIGHVPTSFRRALEIRHQIAVDEARRRIDDSAPTTDKLQAIFPKATGFGARKDIATGKQ
ncbi:hypothetical protein [Defluviimonas salinarum]|nr:hypothetical protein [Defluviimonas salinarum]